MAMFPRRPKVGPSRDAVFGKINQELFVFAEQARALGIPTIAAFPVTSSLWDLTDAAPVIWISLDTQNQSDLEFAVQLSSHDWKMMAEADRVPVSLTDNEVLSLVRYRSRLMDWSEAIERIDILRRSNIGARRDRYLFWDAGYKPIYFLVPEG